MTITRNDKGMYIWKHPITMKNPVPLKEVTNKVEEDFCKHPNKTDLYQEESYGQAIGGKMVRVVWQYMRCPDCRTEKVLVKS